MSRLSLVKRVRNDLILVGLVCIGGYVAYQVLLDEDAKKSISSLVGTVWDSYQRLSDVVNDHVGTIMDQDVVVQNREKVRNAWADLGF